MKIGPQFFSDYLSDKRHRLSQIWPHYLYNHLLQYPTIAKSTISDLKLEIEFDGILFRYWLSRATLYDRPQFYHSDGSWGGYIGGWPRIEVEAYIDGSWELIDGYQGHTV